MNRIIGFVALLFVSLTLNAQSPNQSGPCQKLTDGSNKAFIENVKDGNISRQQISKGFELHLSDPSFKVKSFEVVYEHNHNLNVITNKHKAFVTLGKPYAQDLQQLKLKSVFTLESIQVEKEGVCYTLPSLLYYVKE